MIYDVRDPIKVFSRAALTEEEFFQLASSNKEVRMERDKNGNISIMSPAFPNSAKFEAIAIAALFNWNAIAKNGEVYSSAAGFTLPNGAVRSPDAAWISFQKLNG